MVIGEVLPLMGALVTVVGMPSSPAMRTLRVDCVQNFKGLMIMQAEFEKILSKTNQTVIFITHSIDEAITMGDRIVVMTAGPGQIKTILNVDIPRPRYDVDVRNHPRYQELRNEIWQLLQSEQQTQMDREGKLE